ncbi:XRE family transcriptional regulator [Streptomyces sp. NPDC101490]|uniref:XRE family transcriptional regulator n=1 Tax=Streptomyces sp. NPDC101490 TaxID=3366143 RepID=UPI0037FD9D8B
MYANVKLEARMLQLGYSQSELAKKVNRAIDRLTGRPGSVTDADVRRWLRHDTKWPHDRIRLCIEEVLGASSEDLGFVPRRKRSTTAPPEDGPVHRRTFLTSSSGTALAVATPTLTRLGMSDAARFQAEYVKILKEDWTIGGAHAVEHRAAELSLRIKSALSAGTTSTRVRRRLYCLAADASSSAAFAAIDAKVQSRARTHLDRAVTFAGLSGDSETKYHVWNHLAMTATQREDFSEGEAAAEVMKVLVIARRDPLYASLGHMRNARCLAKREYRTEAVRALRAAEQMFERAEHIERPEWLDFYDQSEVDGLAASVWFTLGDWARAESFFHRALSAIRPEMVRNRALYNAHLALSQAHQGELELACHTGSQAHELGEGSGSKRTSDMLVKVRRVLVTSGSRAPEVTTWVERSLQWS